MIPRIFILLSVLLLSCMDVKPKESEIRQEVNTIAGVETGDSKISQLQLSKPDQLFNGNISELIQKIELSVEKFGYIKQSKYSLEQYKRKQFKEFGFEKIFHEAQFLKLKNKKISIVVYKYDKIDSATGCYNSIKKSRYLDGIFKSGGFLIQHSNYILQVASTCSMSKSELEEIREDLKLSGTYLFCYCGGKCIDGN